MYTLKIINGKRIWVSDTLTRIDPSERAQGHIGRKLQGGDPPVPYRNACSKSNISSFSPSFCCRVISCPSFGRWQFIPTSKEQVIK